MKTELTEAAKQARADYMREWRKRNPEKIKELNRRYWERKARKAANEQLNNTDR